MTGVVLFDTDAMIHVGKQLRHYTHVTEPIARSMGRVSPAALSPDVADVAPACEFLEMGVRSLGELVEGFGNFAVSLGERVKAADSTGGRERAINLARIALFHMPSGVLTTRAGRQLRQLERFWPDVFNSINDVKSAQAAEKLAGELAADAAKNIDAIAAYRRRYPGRPIPAQLREMDKKLRGAGKLASALKKAGIAGSVIAQLVSDYGRDDLTPAQKALRAAEAGAIDLGVGAGAAAGVKALLVKLGLAGVKGPVGWIAAGAGAVLTALGADKAGSIVSGAVLFEPNPNDKARMQLPPEVRSRIDSANGPYRWPDITHPNAEMRHILDLAHTQESRINDLYSQLHSRDPLDPVEYRSRAYDLIRELDVRADLADKLQDLQNAKR
jgi:hypothetical protein